jgi:Ca2+-binding RTX toxin-like protein
VVVLDGDYSAGLNLSPDTLGHMESILLTAGHSYRLSGLSDANFGAMAHVFGGTLGAADSMRANASAMTLPVYMLGGAGADILTGGAGYNTLDGGAGDDRLIGGDHGNLITIGTGKLIAKGGGGADTFVVSDSSAFRMDDKINGKGGMDVLRISYPNTDLDFRDHTIKGIELIQMVGVSSYFEMTMAEGNVAAGQTLTVTFAFNGMFTFDGSAETDGTFVIDDSNDSVNHGILIGGSGDDIIRGNGESTEYRGGPGADQLIGRGGFDTFIYGQVGDSTAERTDVIEGFDNANRIDLHAIDADKTVAGNQAFHLAAAFSGQAGELVVSYNAPRHFTTVLGDVDGDGEADLVISIDGNHGDFTNFVL